MSKVIHPNKKAFIQTGRKSYTSTLHQKHHIFKEKGGNKIPPLIPTMKHEWYFNNVQNASANIITIPDTGTVGGLNISNPALANKPTQSTIGTKISWAADGLDDYIYKATTNFMRSMPTWMVSVVFKYDSSSNPNVFLAASNTANTTTNEGFFFNYNSSNGFSVTVFNNAGTLNNTVTGSYPLVDGQDYIVHFGHDSTSFVWFLETTNIGTLVKANSLTGVSTTNNVTTHSLIRGVSNLYSKSNIAYIGIDEFNLTRLNANVATLKTTFGI